MTEAGVIVSAPGCPPAGPAWLTRWPAGDGRWPLDRPVVVIGRAHDADVQLRGDPLVSRVHARLEQVAGTWTVVDDGLSRNGTFVNGVRVHARQPLHDHDQLRVGTTILQLNAPDDGGPTTIVADAPLVPTRLTPAQRAVVEELCRPYALGGLCVAPATNQQIADELVVSVDTVKTHLRTLFAKLDLEHLSPHAKRLHLVDLALRHGLVTLHDLRREVR